GNVDRDVAAARARAVLDAAGREDVPVLLGEAGASGPAPRVRPVRPPLELSGAFRGSMAPKSAPASGRALTDLARGSPAEITLVALAPLTTIARAVAIEPDLPRLLRGLVVMGGAI